MATRALLAVVVAIALKLAAHWLGWEFISLNPLFSGIVAANVLLMSFLLSGVPTDYKESERLPGELATSLEAIADEAFVIYSSKKAPAAEEWMPAHDVLRSWLYLLGYDGPRAAAVNHRETFRESAVRPAGASGQAKSRGPSPAPP